jgi:hypothetical protein
VLVAVNLSIAQQPHTLRRLGGLAISTPIHLFVLMILAIRGLPAHVEPATVEITYVSPGPADAPLAAVPDPMLLEEAELSTHAGPDQSALALPDFDFDVSKISSRRNLLFPFATTDLSFLRTITRDVQVRRSRLVNPLSSGASANGPSKPPLALTSSEFDRVVDGAWSRRDRWSKFSGVARLLQEHDAEQGRAADLVQSYLDRNILQPICDYRVVTGPPRRETIIVDHMLWLMLENAADHADFVDFVHAFAREHPSSRTTTELLFIVDKLVQANRDALVAMLNAKLEQLSLTASLNRGAFELFGTIQRQYSVRLALRGLVSSEDVKRRYDDVRMSLLTAIVETSPNGYRTGDARFLAGELLFGNGRTADALRWWKGIVPDPDDSYAATYLQLASELRSSPVVDADRVFRVLDQRRAE